jgi:hypothetical protein
MTLYENQEKRKFLESRQREKSHYSWAQTMQIAEDFSSETTKARKK